MCNNFESFSKLPSRMQKEAIREGEERVKAQLAVANNADQRAINWARLQLGSATAALGACAALLGKSEPDYYLAFIALLFAAIITRAGLHALDAATHDREFHLPGNTPAQWLPEQSNAEESEEAVISRCRREQAVCLTDQIAQNADLAAQRGRKMDRCYEAMQLAMALSGAALLVTVAARTALAINGIESTVIDAVSN